MTVQTKILIIEDDKTIVDGLEAAFRFHGHTTVSAANGEDGVYLLATEKPDLVILDVMLPGYNGFEICQKIRQHDESTPIIMLTAKSGEEDKLDGFAAGADDYVTKPFSARELLARIDALLKRSRRTANPSPAPLDAIAVGDVQVNFINFTIKRGDQELQLSPKEHQILKLLMDNPDSVISRHRIIDDVWGEDYFPNPKTIDNFILKLRNKIELDPKKPRHILTVHGAGYKFRF